MLLLWNELSVRTLKGHTLLRQFSGSVEDGEVCGILGPSGAGKVKGKIEILKQVDVWYHF